MLRLIFIYASSTGLQRALVFLAVPLLSGYFSLEILGTYTLTQTLAQFAVPILTWNATVALTREAFDNPFATRGLHNFTATLTIAVSVMLSLIAYLFGAPNWVCLGLTLGGADACFLASIAVLQGKEAARAVFIVSIIKTIGIVIAIAATPLGNLGLEHLLILQILNSYLCAALGFIYARHELMKNNSGQNKVSISTKEMLLYSASTLPHTAALWLSVSSDRLLLGLLVGKSAVGAYALSYTIALSVMLLMSGVIAALPPRIARFPEIWTEPAHISRTIRHVSLAALVVIFSSLAFVVFNERVFTFVENMPQNAGVLVALIGVGFYASFYYVLFASYMYLHRDTSALAKAGWFIAPLNLGIMTVLILLFGSTGAALGLLVCYVNFGMVYYVFASRLETGLVAIKFEAVRDALVLLVLTLGIGVLI